MRNEYETATPGASAMCASLRSIGYSVEHAIADLVDNSVSAGAKKVLIHFEWDGPDSTMTIVDDGRGMSEPELLSAMTLGSRNPGEARAETDLGRFGLGLKTASFSQARRLIVASRRVVNGPVAARHWDLDVLASRNEWLLLKGFPDGSEQLRGLLGKQRTGTVVCWQKMDRVVGDASVDDGVAQRSFHDVIDGVSRHLGMVFHRKLQAETKPNAQPLRIFINGRDEAHRVVPWDPFLTDTDPSAVPIAPRDPLRRHDGSFVQGFVLPHPDKLTDELARVRAGGPRGWASQQGFYIYRQDRLLVAGGWLGLPNLTKEEIYNLCRIRVDLTKPNITDETWNIDVKKSKARPPRSGDVRAKLLRVAEDCRKRARQVFVHRGEYGKRAKGAPFVRPWQSSERKGKVFYKIDQGHPLVTAAVQASTDPAALRLLMRLLEETVPVQRIWLDAAEKPSAMGSPHESAELDDLAAMLDGARKLLLGTGLPAEDVEKRLREMEPFSTYPALFAK